MRLRDRQAIPLAAMGQAGYDSAPFLLAKSTANSTLEIPMGRLTFMFFGLVVGAVGIFMALNYHLLKTSTGLELCPKRSASLSETYVDIRTFTAADWATHVTLSADIVAAEKQHLMGESPAAAVEGSIHEMINEVRQ
jgi:hypothetical protein